MGQIGLGAMISYLGGNEDSVAAFREAVGKTIKSAVLSDDALTLRFVDGTAIDFFDDGQLCCETRYFKTDDDVSRAVGATLVSAEVRNAPNLQDNGYDEHEIQFLDVQTSNGLIQVCAHNEHNGYYGGFSIRVRRVRPEA